MKVIFGDNATMALKIVSDGDVAWLARALVAMSDGQEPPRDVPPMLAAAWPAIEAEQLAMMEMWRKRRENLIRASHTRWAWRGTETGGKSKCNPNGMQMDSKCIPNASVDNSAAGGQVVNPPPDSPPLPPFKPTLPVAHPVSCPSGVSSDEATPASHEPDSPRSRADARSASAQRTGAGTGACAQGGDPTPKPAPSPANQRRIAAFQAAKKRDPAWHPAPTGSDTGHVAHAYSDWFDPKRDPVEMAGRLVREPKGPWRKWASAIGDAAFRDVCATLWGELNAGDYIENPAAILVLKLKDRLEAPKPGA